MVTAYSCTYTIGKGLRNVANAGFGLGEWQRK